MIRVLGRIKRGNIKLYALSTCPFCKKTKDFLDNNQVEYEYIYVDELDGVEREKIMEEVLSMNKRLSFPTVIINRTVIVGHNEFELRKALDL
ncbi:MAG: glutaredoxin family protein [Euryarchaeota archaeon]|nr:glutaredoxin family protein [Euryarchaeota archaeon]